MTGPHERALLTTGLPPGGIASCGSRQDGRRKCYSLASDQSPFSVVRYPSKAWLPYRLTRVPRAGARAVIERALDEHNPTPSSSRTWSAPSSSPRGACRACGGLASTMSHTWPITTRPASNWIHFVGMVHAELKADLLAACDVFCRASPYETFGRAVVEAMASGLVVVTRDSGAPPATSSTAKRLSLSRR
jgi:glycosyltransferase involved in cell wall biosynthesis